jgi:hypothetical protein
MEWIGTIMAWAEPIATALGWISVVIAAVMRLPFIGDATKADGALALIGKVLSFLPSLGVNPRTKALEEALKEVKGE